MVITFVYVLFIESLKIWRVKNGTDFRDLG